LLIYIEKARRASCRRKISTLRHATPRRPKRPQKPRFKALPRAFDNPPPRCRRTHKNPRKPRKSPVF